MIHSGEYCGGVDHDDPQGRLGWRELSGTGREHLGDCPSPLGPCWLDCKLTAKASCSVRLYLKACLHAHTDNADVTKGMFPMKRTGTQHCSL